MLTYMELVRLERSLREQSVLSVYLDGTSENFASQHAWRTQLDTSLKDLRLWLEGSSHTERALFERCVAPGVPLPNAAARLGQSVRDSPSPCV